MKMAKTHVRSVPYDSRTAIINVAAIGGLHLVQSMLMTTTFVLGELIKDIKQGYRNFIIIGRGATND